MSGIIKPSVGAQLKLDHPLARGLVGAWLLNEMNGNKTHDYSGQGNVGTLNQFDLTTCWKGSKHGGAILFDNTDDYIEITHSQSLDITKSITISVWAKWTYPGGVNVLVGKGSYQYLFYWFPNPGRFGLYKGGSENNAAASLTAGVWYHIVAVDDERAGTRGIYLDGKKLTSTGSGYLEGSSSNTVVRIGDSESYSNHMNGEIESALIYNRALSAEEIATLYAFPYAMFEEESPYWILKAAGGAVWIPKVIFIG